MTNISLAKVWADMLLTVPRLSWRIVKMAIASARVIWHRSLLMAPGPKTPQEKLEYRTMVLEKIYGSSEASTAYLRSLNSSGLFSTKAIASAGGATFKAWLALFSRSTSSSFVSRYLRFFFGLVWLLFVVYTQFSLLSPRVFLGSTAPLHKRVTENARRLNRGEAL